MTDATQKLADELKRIRSILSVITGFEDDDQEHVEDARKSVDRIIEGLAEQPAVQQGLMPNMPITDELPNGFVPLQKQNGKLVYAACMDSEARHYKWLMWRHPDGKWVSKRKPEDWEVMQVEDQAHYGIVQEAAHGIKEST